MTTGRINQVTTMTLWRCKREREREMPPPLSLSLTNCPVSHPLPGREGRRQVFFHHWRSSFCLFVLEVDRGGRKPPLPCAQPAKQKRPSLCPQSHKFQARSPRFSKRGSPPSMGTTQQPTAGEEQRPPRIAVDPRVVKSNSTAWPSASNPHPSFALQTWPHPDGFGHPDRTKIGQYKYFHFSYPLMKEGGILKKGMCFFHPSRANKTRAPPVKEYIKNGLAF